MFDRLYRRFGDRSDIFNAFGTDVLKFFHNSPAVFEAEAQYWQEALLILLFSYTQE